MLPHPFTKPKTVLHNKADIMVYKQNLLMLVCLI